MNRPLCAFVVVLFCLSVPSTANDSSPNVQVYSRGPGEFGKANTLICHVVGFHPPEISIKLLKNGKEIDGTHQSDLAFEDNWHYYLTKHVPFTPIEGDKFHCLVTHLGKSKMYTWDSDM